MTRDQCSLRTYRLGHSSTTTLEVIYRKILGANCIHYFSTLPKENLIMLVFIDESGYPRPTDATNNPVLLAVCLHQNDIKSITNQIYKLKDSVYGKQDEIKSTKLIREATITKNRTKNKSYVEGMIDIILSYDAAIFAILMEKPFSFLMKFMKKQIEQLRKH